MSNVPAPGVARVAPLSLPLLRFAPHTLQTLRRSARHTYSIPYGDHPHNLARFTPQRSPPSRSFALKAQRHYPNTIPLASLLRLYFLLGLIAANLLLQLLRIGEVIFRDPPEFVRWPIAE